MFRKQLRRLRKRSLLRLGGPHQSSPHKLYHPILKVTTTHVFVHPTGYDPKGLLKGDHARDRVRAIRLNRHWLEQNGCAWCPEVADYLYLAADTSLDSEYPRCFEQLGLDPPCTVEEVKRAYRSMCKRLHPDHGGDPDQFRTLRLAYEQAMQWVALKPG